MSRGKCARAALAGIILPLLASAGTLAARELPSFKRNGETTQLHVDGQPVVLIAGELHNSSASSPAYMAPIWDKLARNGVKTVIGTASWELVEPEEGRFNFSEVDDQIRQARQRNLRLVMIWFGAYKNAESTYAPSWVRRDDQRFPRAVRDPAFKATGMAAYLKFNPALSAFGENLVRADARAFAALMRHIKQVDRDQTVIMVQVENEVGLLADSRDWSAPAAAAWDAPVPAELTAYLERRRDVLKPHLLQLWGRNGFRTSGTWREVFGDARAAHEVFMAWGFSRYVEQVAKAGAREYPLPMFANAWLGPQPRAPEPGDYPTGGPVARMMDVWKAGAPSLALLAPDIYIDDFAGTLGEFQRDDNPVFIPEAKPDAGNLFLALGQYRAVGFSPFGIEDVPDGTELFQAYHVLDTMVPEIVAAQANGTIRAVRLTAGGSQRVDLGGYTIAFQAAPPTAGAFGPGTGSAAQAPSPGYALILQVSADEFLIVGRNVMPRFELPGQQVELDSTVEGSFVEGRWIPGRTLNGDERWSLFPTDGLRTIRFRLLRRPAR